MATIRQQIIELLSTREMNARDLSQELHIMEKEVYVHLEHIERTLAAQRMRMKMRPSVCLACGYIFQTRKKWSKPGRCPVCRKGHINQALYTIVSMAGKKSRCKKSGP